MASTKIQGNASGSGSVTVTAPNTNSNRTVTLPDADITIPNALPGADSGYSKNVLTTQGDTLYASGANTLARLAKGTAGQVLKMNSGATAPEWGTDVGGALVFVGEQTLSGSTDTTINVEDTALFDGTYDQVLLRITDHHPNTDESMFIARGKYGGSYQTTSHYIYNSMIFYEDSYAYMSAGSAAANNHPAFRLGKQIGNAAGESFCCDFWIDSPADTVNYKLFRWYPTYVRTSVQIMHGFGAGMYTNSTTGQGALQGVQFGNFDSSASAAQLKDIKIRKYGFKKS